jgi:hypothetical protein
MLFELWRGIPDRIKSEGGKRNAEGFGPTAPAVIAPRTDLAVMNGSLRITRIPSLQRGYGVMTPALLRHIVGDSLYLALGSGTLEAREAAELGLLSLSCFRCFWWRTISTSTLIAIRRKFTTMIEVGLETRVIPSWKLRVKRMREIHVNHKQTLHNLALSLAL